MRRHFCNALFQGNGIDDFDEVDDINEVEMTATDRSISSVSSRLSISSNRAPSPVRSRSGILPFCILHSVFCIVFAAFAAHATTIDPSNYNHSMTIRPASGKVTSTLTGFPLLVRLSTARQPWFNPLECGTNGADLRFALADGTLLAHEVDMWSESGESVV